MSKYQAEFNRSMQERESYWGEIAKLVHWEKRWDKVLDESNKPYYRWFPGAEVNTCYNALDLHVAQGRGDQNALIYDSAMTGEIRHYTYRQLTEDTARFAGALSEIGVEKVHALSFTCR